MRYVLLAMAVSACAAPGRDVPAKVTLSASKVTEAPAPMSTPAAKKDSCEDDAFGLAEGAGEIAVANIEKKRGTMGTTKKQLVVSSHPLATDAGLAVLRAGGNAADAFVAAVLAQDVLLPGVTSTAGLTGILVYQAKTKKVTYVHGGLADPADPARRYRPGDARIGKFALIPGAPAAYAELVKRFGSKPLTTLVEPAAAMASKGFVLDALYARAIERRREVLERTAYGKKAFFRNGKGVAEGETLTLPEFAKTLRAYGKDPSWFYRGAWVKEAVTVTGENGGSLEAVDFAGYAPEIAEPMHAPFMGNDVYAAGPGGLKLLASLGALERLRKGAPGDAVSASADALEMLLRLQRAGAQIPAVHDRDLVSKGAGFNAQLSRHIAETAATVEQKMTVASPAAGGTHSSAVVVVDSAGNVVVGTHTIETANWGEGLFAGGVPLSTAAPIGVDDATKATTRMRTDPLSNTLVLAGGAPRAALAIYGSGLHPADVQILDAVLARGLDAEGAVLAPRVGYFLLDVAKGSVDASQNVVDPRFDAALLCTMKERGFGLSRSMPGYPAGFVDTGFPTLVTFDNGAIHGMPPDAPFIHGSARGD
jgi:gamma-glutamyltranspeptidase/glutathione hydrolase